MIGSMDPTERIGRKRLLIEPVHAVVVVLLAALALTCFAIVNRGGDTARPVRRRNGDTSAPVSQPGVAVPSPA